MMTIAPTDTAGLSAFGDLYWLDELQPLRGLENAPNGIVETLRSTTIANVDQVRIVSGLDHGCSPIKATILTMPVQGSIDGATLLEAVWAGYMLSLKTTMDAGHEDAHVGDDEDAIALADAIVARLGATATPSDEIYGSGGTFLELLEFTYDPETRVLSVDPCIGS